MPSGCVLCKHYRNKPHVHKRLRLGYCGQVDDGYTNDCLLLSEEAQADEQINALKQLHRISIPKTQTIWVSLKTNMLLN
jgi:hypothetical protein